MDALVGHELRSYHVVVSEEFEYLVEENLSGIRNRRRPGVKKDGRTQLIIASGDDTLEVDTLDDLFEVTMATRRTFLRIVPLLHDTASVNQSTTEHYGKLGIY